MDIVNVEIKARCDQPSSVRSILIGLIIMHRLPLPFVLLANRSSRKLPFPDE